MRFDYAVWKSLPGILGLGYFMQTLHSRVERFTAALDAAGIPYGVCGGFAVIAWVTQANADYVRTTKDVDVCMRRIDLERAAIALKPHGFELTEVMGIPMFLDGPDATPKQAVHIVLAEDPVPDLGPGVRDESFHWARVELDRLLTMKMIANRIHDQTHIVDLYRSGAIDRTCIDLVPPHLRQRLKDVFDRCEREYGNSPH